MSPKPSVKIFEVGPRDGLQSQSKILNLADREELVMRLAKAGLRDIEVGSFVRDDRIPQLSKTSELLERLHKKFNSTKDKPSFWAFVPNMKGLEAALETPVDGVAFFVATSNTFCLRNVNRSQKELLAELKLLIPKARKSHKKTRIYISTISFCPYEGPIAASKTLSLVKELYDLGATEFALGDTTGHSTPKDIEKILSLLLKNYSANKFAMHLHDTRALALANALCAIQLGIRKIDSSIGGLGGCPYAPGAAGNLATEDLVYMLNEMGWLKEKIKLSDLAQTSRWLESRTQTILPSKVLKTL